MGITSQFLTSLFVIAGAASSFATATVTTIEEKCAKVKDHQIYQQVWQSKLQLHQIDRIHSMDQAKKTRLPKSIYFENGQYWAEYKNPYGKDIKFRVAKSFINSVIHHLEVASKKRFFFHLIPEDLGHAHFQIPKPFLRSLNEEELQNPEFNFYENLISHPETLAMYHASENLDFEGINESHTSHNYYHLWKNRNIFGELHPQGKVFTIFQPSGKSNTVRHFDDNYKYWGAGFNLKASPVGCFQFKHKVLDKFVRFDISFSRRTAIKR